MNPNQDVNRLNSPSEVSPSGKLEEFNMILVGEGNVDVQQAAEHILNASRSSGLLYHGADVVLVHESQFHVLFEAFHSCFASRRWGAEHGKAVQPETQVHDGFKDATALEEAILTSRRRGTICIVKISSLDQAVDSARRLPGLSYLAFLNPKSKEESMYIFKWTKSHFFSTGKFRSIPISEGWSCHGI